MDYKDIELTEIPTMENGILIAGFEGWGNALEVSRGMTDYLIRKLSAKPFGRFNPDLFYVYKERRPIVEVDEGNLVALNPPGCELFITDEKISGRSTMILAGSEPDMQWFRFADTLFSLCRAAGVKTIISCGALLDNIHHSETILSIVASTPELIEKLRSQGASVINYRGESSIHSTLHSEAKKKGFDCIGIYGHCPYYLQGITHYGLLDHMGRFISQFAELDLDCEELALAWKDMAKQIHTAVDNSPELKDVVSTLKKGRARVKIGNSDKDEKVIKLEDYLRI